MLKIEYAELTGFVKLILFFVFIYYVYKFFLRFLFPYFIKKLFNKMKQKTENQYKNMYEETIKEGETIIDKKPKKTKKINNSVGQYVDFEEID